MNAIMKPMPQMVRYEAACTALAEAKAVDEVKDIRDKADAMRIYGMQAKNKTLEIDAAEIRIRAERRLGELLSEQKSGAGLNTGAMGIGKSAVANDDRTPTLAAVGITKDLSSRAQKLAAVPVAEFEAEVGDWRNRVKAEHARVTTRLERAGERSIKNADILKLGASLEKAREFAKKNLATIRSLKSELAKRDATIESLNGLLAESRDNARDLADSLEAAIKSGEGDAAVAKEIKKLTGQIRVAESQRDQYMTKCNELVKSVKSLQHKLDKCEAKK